MSTQLSRQEYFMLDKNNVKGGKGFVQWTENFSRLCGAFIGVKKNAQEIDKIQEEIKLEK